MLCVTCLYPLYPLFVRVFVTCQFSPTSLARNPNNIRTLIQAAMLGNVVASKSGKTRRKKRASVASVKPAEGECDDSFSSYEKIMNGFSD